MRDSGNVKSARRVLEILDLLAEAKQLTLTEIVQSLEIPKSSGYNLLQTLLQAGYVNLDPESKRYELGGKLRRIASRFPFNPDLITEFDQVGRLIGHECDETVQLGVLDGTEIIHIGRVEASHPLRFIAPVGQRFPAHATALGKVLLSSLTEDQVDALYRGRRLDRLTPSSITRLSDLKKELEKIRRQGWATDLEETFRDLCCIAAPVFGKDRQVVAAMSISVPKSRFPTKRRKELRELVLEGASELSTRMGVPLSRSPHRNQSGRARGSVLQASRGV